VTAPSAVETLDTWFAKLREVHARTNCVAWWDEERAYTTARRLDEQRARGARAGPLHGVPFTAKEWLDTEGLPGTGGFEATGDRTAKHDASVVARMREAGAILMAKTAVQVETAQFGKVCNPHDPARSPGASSSGEAAAVGGGGSPVGLASDSGGSIPIGGTCSRAAFLRPPAAGRPARAVGE